MLRILLIVAALGVAHADIADYSKAAVQDIFSPGSDSISSQLINPDIEIQFQTTSDDNQVRLIPGKASAPAKGDTNCGNDLGVIINHEPHCILSAVVLNEVEKSGKKGLQLELAFKLQSQPVVLAVPILKIPAETTSSNEQWAADKDVVLAPADIQQLSDIDGKKSVKIGFKWLSKLLEKGVTQSTDKSAHITVHKLDVECKPYLTKPVVLSSSIAQKLAGSVAGKL